MRTGILIATGAVLVGAAVLYRRQDQSGEDIGVALDGIAADFEAIAVDIVNTLSGYSPDKVPSQYRGAIAQAETANAIPAGMLARLLWQESRFNPKIIDGRQVSPVGALGIAQFMPETAKEWGVDPLDPFAAIAGAGRYLAWLFRQVGAWDKALAAYNWGIGNVKKKGLAVAPLETRNYFSQILADIGLGSVA